MIEHLLVDRAVRSRGFVWRRQGVAVSPKTAVNAGRVKMAGEGSGIQLIRDTANWTAARLFSSVKQG